MIKKPFLFIALDDLLLRSSTTLDIVTALNRMEEYRQEIFTKEYSFGYKVNLDYLFERWHSLRGILEEVQVFGRPVFADMKMFNGSRTMAGVAKALVALGVDYFNVHALADKEIEEVIKVTEGTKTKVLAVTVLTHYDEDYCKKHFLRSFEETVEHFTDVAIERGFHGVILPGTTLDRVREKPILKAVPGIRPKGYKDARHKQEIETQAAVEKGADILICGSPIMKSPDPKAALKSILYDMKGKTLL